MTEVCSSLRRMTRLSAIVVPLAAIILNASAASAQPALGKASGFAVLAGVAVTCTASGTAVVNGDVGEWPGKTFTNSPPCTINGAVHLGDGVAKQAYNDFINAYDNLLNNPPTCDFTLAGSLAAEVLVPGVYCIDSSNKTGTLMLDAQGHANAEWLFLVDGALTGTNFNVVMTNGGDPCNVYWRAAAATLTTSNFLGTILSGAAITVTATDGTVQGGLFATTAVTLTLTNSTVTACEFAGGHGKGHGKCNQGVGNGPETCDPGNSNNHNPSNDELGGTPGNPGRKPGGPGGPGGNL
jgi:hypothetical protein